ncbi:triphosphoribosyl-dephospho-CoA synthase [Derxia gummosa]|uniref:Triphosphoribosyl-dephospho-CoA synthase n=1 Tax=Derxia gummosa DSM 723 TaxID=1121388 RepID=A0A8B6X8G7_9BURK|nr:triphosphoribosyl-dephospho-CoA synthase [Derxia gummosa]
MGAASRDGFGDALARPAGRVATGDARLERAFLFACALDVAVAKPGNVSLDSAGHGMEARMFIDSARASLPGLLRPGAAVGERAEAAVIATRAAVGCNTNLGILLLGAPIALAAERLAARAAGAGVAAEAGAPPASASDAGAADGGAADEHPADGGTPADAARARLRFRFDRLCAELDAVLATLTVADARHAYRAIAHASPGGLGDAPEQSVHAEPTIDLRAAMRLAADRDLVAAQYADGFPQVRQGAARFLRDALGTVPQAASDGRPEAAMLDVFMTLLAAHPDSHIARKRGTVAAQTVTDTAAALWFPRPGSPEADRATLLAGWDAELKSKGINPGTTADLSVASAFMAACVMPKLVSRAGAGVSRLLGTESDS